MIMSWIYTGLVCLSILCAMMTHHGAALATAIPQGAQSGLTLTLSMAGSICLWSGIGKLMEHSGITDFLSKMLEPILHRLFPGSRKNLRLKKNLTGNICANLLGLGNAATPLGIQAVKEMTLTSLPGIASDEMCRLIVLNTASIQLIPANVAALRSALGSESPFDILPAVWFTSLCSAGLGVLAAWIMGKAIKHD